MSDGGEGAAVEDIGVSGGINRDPGGSSQRAGHGVDGAGGEDAEIADCDSPADNFPYELTT